MILALLLLATLLIAAIVSINIRQPICDGKDKLDNDGMCIIKTLGGCKYDPKLGPDAAICQ